MLLSGLLLLGADSNLLKSNHIAGNGTVGPDRDGLSADMNSKNNQILDNHMSNNVGFDCRDDSVGTGTAGTANTWNNDMGTTQNRPGLCK